MPHSTDHAPKYSPSSNFEPLAEADTDISKLLHILFDEATPFLNRRILGEMERENVIQDILTIRCCLRQKFRLILQDLGLTDVIEQFVPERSDHDSRIPGLEEICRAIKNPELLNDAYSKLSRARSELTADILERLGFADHVFDRREYAKSSDGRIDAERMMDLLDDVVLSGGGSELELPEWITRVNKEFPAIIHKAFSALNLFRQPLIPKNTFRQPFEMTSDLAGKSLLDLINIFLDSSLQSGLRRRLDALYMVMFALAYFKLHQDPVFQAQNEAHTAILDRLEMFVWSEQKDHTDLRVRRVNGRNVFRLAGKRHEPSKDDSISFARRISPEIAAIFHGYDDIIDHPDYVCFDSRVKSEFSTVIKLFLIQESVRQALKKLGGYTAEIFPKRDDAERKIKEIRGLMQEFHHPEVDLEEKPADLCIIRDNVGLTFAIPLRKSLSRMMRDEKIRLTHCMNEFADYLIGALDIEEGATKKNNLWKIDRTRNPKRQTGFRDFKIYGSKRVMYEGREVSIPVEIQIQPFDTYALARSPASGVRHGVYDANKAHSLEPRFMPHKVAGQIVYPSTKSRGLIEVVNPADHMVSTSPTS